MTKEKTDGTEVSEVSEVDDLISSYDWSKTLIKENQKKNLKTQIIKARENVNNALDNI